MKIITLSNFSAGFLSRFISTKLHGEIVDSEYGQYVQLMCINGSELYQTPHNAALLLLDYNNLLSSMRLDKVKSLLIELTECYFQYSNGNILIINNAYLKRGVTSVGDAVIYNSSKNTQADINLFLNQLSKQNKSICVFDMLSIYEEHGYYNLTDHNINLISDNPFSKLGLEMISSEIVDYVNAILGSKKKCLVLDFDNTLWGGIAGEDGLNVKIGDDRLGGVYLQFQKEIKKLKDKGVLLASCSKNNLEDAKKIFDSNPNMILKWDDFIIHKVNWERKDINVLEISDELNIGDDSLVFIDDSPTERLLVAKGTNAKVPEFPKDFDLIRMISEVDRKYFSTNVVTVEDTVKHQQYLGNIQRTNMSKKYSDISDFINSLEMKLFIKLNDKGDLERAFQLAQKTNQFNFTTNRYSKNEIQDLMNSSTADVLTCRVEDRFGDYGTTVLLVILREGLTWKIDNFLMSCRVLGKQVENAVLNWYLTNRYNGENLEAYYKPTKKNKQLENKYEELGFINLEKTSSCYIYQLESIRKFNLSVEVYYE
jgi:FkbH-like protein